MKEQVPGKVMTQRSEVIRKLSERNRLDYMQSMEGKDQRVLIEKVTDGKARGYGEHYLPVEFAVENPTTNRFEQVRMTGTTPSADPVMQGTLII